MEIRNLITFSKITHVKSFIKAAKELGYAQSTITTQIQLLEQELGVKLFERVGKNMKLTSKGSTFLEYAEKIINLTKEAKEAVIDTEVPQGTLKIGVVESLCTMKLPEILESYHLKYPEVEIIIKIGTCSALHNMLKDNLVDLVLILWEPINDSDLISCMSYKEDMALLASPLNMLINKKNLTLKDISHEPLILTENGCSYRNVFISMFYKEGLQPHLSLEVGSIETIKTFVMSNLGITLLPVMTVKNELSQKKLVTLDLINCEFNMTTQLLYHKNKWVTAAMKAFILDINN
ncbi:LysR family transcriptional regulator [Clostridium sp.]|jgi:DNA-binding transcriptional LysR family regulator|uniref:LysR family transcriptional regulator n=1 Tax=Clostridium sp. TaxID=1506 RepID=UPI0025874222|nr:LysR family transcriptional regulator [Clostridium sp.]MDF2505525.1 transcriptional regulator [Clostridium sp.]